MRLRSSRLLAASAGHAGSHVAAAGIHQHAAAGLGIEHLDPARVGQHMLARIVHRDGHDLVPRRETPERVAPNLRR